MEPFEILETDEVGRATATYIVSFSASALSRVDAVRTVNKLPLIQRFLGVFLPTGYPHTVSSDYTPYQIYSSLQAFFSAIAGLLASRAVLQGLGVGDQNATATAATLLSIAQESLGRFATIFFAHWASRRMESDCKFYRLLADIFNDCALVMDCLSPSVPKTLRIPLLCTSSICRAICVVAAGSSKAIISAHFARSNNLGELSAKDSSQVTVTSLLGMWAGGLVVSQIDGNFATWMWLVCLLSLHLITNYFGVCSVSMTTLNHQRTNIVFSSLGDLDGTWRAATPREVAAQERIFASGNALTWQSTHVGSCRFGSLQDLLGNLDGNFKRYSASKTGISISLPQFFGIFQKVHYILWFSPQKREAIIVLKMDATAQTEIDAWCHAIKIAKAFAIGRYVEATGPSGVLQALEDTLSSEDVQEKRWKALEQAGWDIKVSLLETSLTKRIQLEPVTATVDAAVLKQSPIG